MVSKYFKDSTAGYRHYWLDGPAIWTRKRCEPMRLLDCLSSESKSFSPSQDAKLAKAPPPNRFLFAGPSDFWQAQ